MSKGIVLIAAGNHVYGQWAMNLCMSIKSTDAKANISLLHYGDGLAHIKYYPYHFDHIIEIPREMMLRNGLESMLRSKVCLYDLTPYTETIFIDADVVCFPNKKITELFEVLKEVDFTTGNRGVIDPVAESKFSWAPAKVLMEKYNHTGVIFNLSSEFIYFKKGNVSKKIFEEAKKAFDNPQVDFRLFAGGVPDELAFQIAMIKCKANPHEVGFLPFYWEPYEKKQLQLHELYKTGFYGYSMGGNQIHEVPLNNYNNLARHYSQLFGIKFPFLMRDKRSFLPERTTI